MLLKYKMMSTPIIIIIGTCENAASIQTAFDDALYHSSIILDRQGHL